jgi:hypothetical protein
MNENSFTIGEMAIMTLAAKLSNSRPVEVVKSVGVFGAFVSVSEAIASAIESGEYSYLANQFSEVIEESQKELKNEIRVLSDKVKDLNFELEQLKNISKNFTALPISEMRKFGIIYKNKRFYFQEYGYENLNDAISYAKKNLGDT